MCVLLFHETVLPKRRRIMVEIFFDAFDKTVFDMDNLVGLVGNATLVGDNTMVKPSFSCKSFNICITSTDVLLSSAPVVRLPK